jgi:hypothetical protein
LYKLTVELDPGQSLEEAVAAFDDNPAVEYAQFNHIVSIFTTPNDSLYSIQWPLNNTGQSYPGGSGTTDCDIDAPEAWDISTGSGDVVVAVIDTGVDDDHRDLDDNMWTDANGFHGKDFVNDDNDPMDDHGHGTHCAGIIAAEGNNNYDISGVNWTARIMAIKFLDSYGWGTSEDAISAVTYAVNNGADILSNSWGGSEPNQAAQDAFDYAHSQGVISIAAAGNKTWPWEDPTQPTYPAACQNVVAVAATDSDDEMASFSYRGEWVDLAAPGVDVLSLRATGTSMGPPYDDYTIVSSGTSMACPHVAGACALLLSVNSAVSPNDVREILVGTVDPIDDGVCYSDGRLNCYNVARVGEGKGFVWLHRDYYSCSDEVEIRLVDVDLAGESTQDVNVVASGGDEETVTLSVTETNGCTFTATLQTSGDTVELQDGELQLSHGETITVTCYDANDGTGSPASPNDTASADCQGPVVSNVEVNAPGSIATVTFETDEPATSVVRCDVNCGASYSIEGSDSTLATSHTIKLRGFSPETDYFFIIEANDALENQTVDDNDTNCYNFTTTSALGDINVPGDFGTIQDGINRAWPGDTVWVADGVYTGSGNYDIDFLGLAITVRSKNGADNCVIDCQMEGRGFVFHENEDANSVLDGFTIKNGYATATVSLYDKEGFGGGIYCVDSTPTITNCTIVGSYALTWGGGLYAENNPGMVVSNCTFSRNIAWWGGGIYCKESSLTLENCLISENTATVGWGGGIRCDGDVNIVDCTITNNIASKETGGGVCASSGNISISDSIISRNKAVGTGGIGFHNADASMVNCVVSDNNAQVAGGCSFNLGTFTLTNCTIANNTASGTTQRFWDSGGILAHRSTTTIIENCILWSNTGETVNAIYQIASEDEPSVLSVSYSDIEDGQEEVYVDPYATLTWGPGNIDSDPNFAFEDDYHILSVSPCIDAGTNDPCSGLPDTDIDDNNRPLDGDGDSNAVADMGAYEYNSQAPSIALSPPLLQFSCWEGGDDPNDRTLSARNTGGGTLYWQISEDCTWLQAEPNTGASAGEVDTVTVSVDSNGLTVGNYECQLAVCDDNSVNSPRSVAVSLHVGGTLHVPTEYPTIQMAINSARDGDTVEVADGTYTGNGNRDIEFYGKAITVKSESGPQGCIVNCEGSASEPHRGFTFYYSGEDANAILDGFTITRGYVNDDLFAPLSVIPYFGGAIVCHSSSEQITVPSIRNCIIRESHAAIWGGGISYGAPETEDDRSCIANCIITHNYADDWGGGIYAFGCLTIANSIITRNESGDLGGGILSESMSQEYINCTISDNSASGSGGGIYISGNCYGNAIKATNCILWDNSAPQGAEISLLNETTPLDSNDVELIISYSDVRGGTANIHVDPDATLTWGTGNINSDPCFIDADSNDYHLVGSNSPCFNAGDPNGDYSGELDIDGDDRVMDSNVDMGADEIGCMSYDHPDYDDWVEWGKPDCWCYKRQCHADADGLKIGSWWVQAADDTIFRSAFLKTDEELKSIENGICADFDHKKIMGKRVQGVDLTILRTYFEESEPNVPCCDYDNDCGPDGVLYNFWTEP